MWRIIRGRGLKVGGGGAIQPLHYSNGRFQPSLSPPWYYGPTTIGGLKELAKKQNLTLIKTAWLIKETERRLLSVRTRVWECNTKKSSKSLANLKQRRTTFKTVVQSTACHTINFHPESRVRINFDSQIHRFRRDKLSVAFIWMVKLKNFIQSLKSYNHLVQNKNQYKNNIGPVPWWILWTGEGKGRPFLLLRHTLYPTAEPGPRLVPQESTGQQFPFDRC